jgi:inositol-phosphate phosphatase / L-galactose 1-phosphate phosphatase / histidinol-phosphatase
MTLDDLLATALAVSEAARPVPLGYFRKPLEVIAKADESPVTIADRETERVMREVLAAQVPEHGIFGEEHGRERLDHRFVWVLDPIDGTRSFITGMPLFNNLVALLDGGVPVIGVVDTPAIGERYHAFRGRGAWFNGTPIRTSGCTSLSDAAVYRAGHAPTDPDNARRSERFAATGRVNRYGYDAYVYALLAAGHVDLMLETDLEPYDYLALVPLIEAAGGVITDWTGAPLRLHSTGEVLAAATAELHAEALALLRAD